MTPTYSGGVGAAWLAKGGVYVVANIRGAASSGRPGTRRRSRRTGTRRTRLRAVAQDLIARKVTSPAHLGAMGGSNGGLLMGNVALGWPDLFTRSCARCRCST